MLDDQTLKNLDFIADEPVRQKRAEESRNRILEAAIEDFGYMGFEGVSTHVVAAKADVTQGLVTYHFKNKEGLWKAAMDRLFGEMRNQLAKRFRELNEVDDAIFFKLIIRYYTRWAAAHPFIMSLMIQEGKRRSPRLEWLVNKHIRPIYETTVAFIIRGQEMGVIKQGDPTMLYYQFMGTALIYAVHEEVKILTDIDVMQPQFIESQADIFTDLVFKD